MSKSKTRKGHTLALIIPILQRVGADIGKEITLEEIADKLGMSLEELQANLQRKDSGKGSDLVRQMLVAFEDVWTVHLKKARSGEIRMGIDILRRKAGEAGVTVTDEEMAVKLGLTMEQWNNYVNGEEDVPSDLSRRLLAAFPAN